jgi:hypothetical protein
MDDTRILIAKGGKKREISFPFELCLSRAAARWLRDQLKQMDHDESPYGWITIAHPVDMQGQPNTQPSRWED